METITETKQKLTKPLHHIQYCLLFQSLHYLFSKESNLDISSPASLYINHTWMRQSTAQLSIIHNAMQVKITVFLQCIACYSISMLFSCKSHCSPNCQMSSFSNNFCGTIKAQPKSPIIHNITSMAKITDSFALKPNSVACEKNDDGCIATES